MGLWKECNVCSKLKGVFFEEGNINKIEFYVIIRDLCHIFFIIYIKEMDIVLMKY